MFSGFMVSTWEVASIVALVAGLVGFFVVLRGSSFVAHAIPQSGFAGAAAANLVGVSSALGLGVFALISAIGIAWLSRRGRHDVVTALALVVMLALGALFLSFSSEYAPEVEALLFGQVLGVASSSVIPTLVLGAVAVVGLFGLYRPLLVNSVMPEVGEANGVNSWRLGIAFVVLVALVTTVSVPVVGALLVFSLMIGPAGAARSLTSHPLRALALSGGIALVVVWISIASSYLTNWPVGFFVGALGAIAYALGRSWASWRMHRP